MTARRWVKRNEDKPHRCPECHAVATWYLDKFGPRTRLICPRNCGVQWRVGARLTRQTVRHLERYGQRDRIGGNLMIWTVSRTSHR